MLTLVFDALADVLCLITTASARRVAPKPQQGAQASGSDPAALARKPAR